MWGWMLPRVFGRQLRLHCNHFTSREQFGWRSTDTWIPSHAFWGMSWQWAVGGAMDVILLFQHARTESSDIWQIGMVKDGWLVGQHGKLWKRKFTPLCILPFQCNRASNALGCSSLRMAPSKWRMMIGGTPQGFLHLPIGFGEATPFSRSRSKWTSWWGGFYGGDRR